MTNAASLTVSEISTDKSKMTQLSFSSTTVQGNPLGISSSNLPSKVRHSATFTKNRVILASPVLSQYTRITDDRRQTKTFKVIILLVGPRGLALSVLIMTITELCNTLAMFG